MKYIQCYASWNTDTNTHTHAQVSVLYRTQSQAVTLWLSHVNVKPFTYVPTSLVFTVNVWVCVHVSVSVGNICQHTHTDCFKVLFAGCNAISRSINIWINYTCKQYQFATALGGVGVLKGLFEINYFLWWRSHLEIISHLNKNQRTDSNY